MSHQKFPIGIADFRTVRTDDCYYVDKTPHIERLIDQGRYYFLSRPRRFGKSLLLSTMLELFEGSESLFRGLHIHERWDWSTRYPVVRLSFGGNHFSKPGILESNVRVQLEYLENEHGLPAANASTDVSEPDRFGNLLYHIHAVTGKQVVVLVDEYDKPILDAIEVPELAVRNREFLQGLYAVIKDFGAQIRFAFLTGITMFSKVSLFCALNNLEDISLDPNHSTVCGYTENDLQTVFSDQMYGLDLDEIRLWYNGYNWCGKDKVYNPWAILHLLKRRQYDTHWSSTGMPSYLYKVMMERKLTPLDMRNLKVEKSFVSTFDVDQIGAEALLFQSGYLTITSEHKEGVKIIYLLDYPNLEVRSSLNEGYLKYLFQGGIVPVERTHLSGLLTREDFVGFSDALRTLFSAIAYQWHGGEHRQNDKAKWTGSEGWYCAVLFSCLWDGFNIDLRPAEQTSRGRSDLVVVIGSQVFVFECKMLSEGVDADQRASEALAQIRDRGYAHKYRDGRYKIYLLGAVFDAEDRNLATLKVARD